MAFVINDRVKETTTSIGTGTINLAGATVGFDSFVSGIGTTNSTYYAITVSQGVWEVGIGTVTDAATDTLSRDTVISNSSGNTSKIDFAAGEKDVFCTIPAKRTLDEDQTLDSGVLAGPVTVTGTQIITGTLAIV